MSTINSSLALEEINNVNLDILDLLPVRHLSISNNSVDQQSSKVIAVSGSITVSF